MEWFSNIIPTLSGLPWYAVAAIIVLSIGCTKGIDALLKLRKSSLEERQYDDAQSKAGYEALVAELKARVEKLESLVEKASNKLDISQTAHAKCEIEQERLRGEMNVMKEKIARLEAHDERGQKHIEQLAKVVEEKNA